MILLHSRLNWNCLSSLVLYKLLFFSFEISDFLLGILFFFSHNSDIIIFLKPFLLEFLLSELFRISYFEWTVLFYNSEKKMWQLCILKATCCIREVRSISTFLNKPANCCRAFTVMTLDHFNELPHRTSVCRRRHAGTDDGQRQMLNRGSSNCHQVWFLKCYRQTWTHSDAHTLVKCWRNSSQLPFKAAVWAWTLPDSCCLLSKEWRWKMAMLISYLQENACSI